MSIQNGNNADATTLNAAFVSKSADSVVSGKISLNKATGSGAAVPDLQLAISNKIDAVPGKGLSTEDYTTAEKNKLAGVATGATVNDTDANLRARSNHTGTQTASTISDFQTAVSQNTDLLAEKAKQANVVAPSGARAFQIDSTLGGFLGPRMTTTQRDTLSAVPVGLEIFNTDTNKKQIYASGVWSDVGGSSSGSVGTLKYLKFTASGTFTAPAGTNPATIYKVTCVGPGGGGSMWGNAGGGGGGGATSISYVSGLAAGATVAVTVGVGGAGATTNATSGLAGTANTSFGTYCVAAPGAGGVGNGAQAYGASGGLASAGTGDIKLSGGSGTGGYAGSGNMQLGCGGSSTLGGGGRGSINAVFPGGQVGGDFGGGGGAGWSAAGGAGANGIVIIEWTQ